MLWWERQIANVVFSAHLQGNAKRSSPYLLYLSYCDLPQKDERSSGDIKDKSSYLVWLGENQTLGWICEAGVGGSKQHQATPRIRWIQVSSHLLRLCGPWFCPRTSWGGGGGGSTKLGMGRCEGWGEGGCWRRGERWLNSDRAFLFLEWGSLEWGGSGGLWMAMGRFLVAYWCYLLKLTSVRYMASYYKGISWNFKIPVPIVSGRFKENFCI